MSAASGRVGVPRAATAATSRPWWTGSSSPPSPSSSRRGPRWSGPLLQSTAFDDGAGFQYTPSGRGGGAAATEDDLRTYWSRMFGDANVEPLLQLYPPADYAVEEAADPSKSRYW